jgi:hypothetical protein
MAFAADRTALSGHDAAYGARVAWSSAADAVATAPYRKQLVEVAERSTGDSSLLRDRSASVCRIVGVRSRSRLGTKQRLISYERQVYIHCSDNAN